MQLHPWILGEKRLDPRGFVRREIIRDHVNLFVSGLMGHEVGQKGGELSRGVARCGLAQHLARFGVDHGVQREGAVTDVLKTMALARPGDRGNTRSLRSSA